MNEDEIAELLKEVQRDLDQLKGVGRSGKKKREPEHGEVTILAENFVAKHPDANMGKTPPPDAREYSLKFEGARAPNRVQSKTLNKVWRYRNFKSCKSCGAYDTWESRQLAETKGVRVWCYSCGAQDHAVAENMPAKHGSVKPGSNLGTDPNKWRQDAALASRRLFGGPMTAMELARWFKDSGANPRMDLNIAGLLLRKMQRENMVSFDRASGTWRRKDAK